MGKYGSGRVQVGHVPEVLIPSMVYMLTVVQPGIKCPVKDVDCDRLADIMVKKVIEWWYHAESSRKLVVEEQ